MAIEGLNNSTPEKLFEVRQYERLLALMKDRLALGSLSEFFDEENVKMSKRLCVQILTKIWCV